MLCRTPGAKAEVRRRQAEDSAPQEFAEVSTRGVATTLGASAYGRLCTVDTSRHLELVPCRVIIYYTDMTESWFLRIYRRRVRDCFHSACRVVYHCPLTVPIMAGS
eukprot:scaffold1938_cov399-Prasinococcus_capsulatus_cf.AAC.31